MAAVQYFAVEPGRRKKLRKHLEIEFEQRKNRQIYWDDVAMFCYPQEYELGVRQMQQGDIMEIDGLEELILLDAAYTKYRQRINDKITKSVVCWDTL